MNIPDLITSLIFHLKKTYDNPRLQVIAVTHEDGSFYHWMTWEKNKPIPDTGRVKVKHIPLSKIKEVKFK